MATVHRVRPVIGLDKEKVPELTSGSQVVHDKWSENLSTLGNPPIDLPILQGQIGDVNSANVAMRTDKAAGPTRKIKIDILWATLESYRLTLQQLCDKHPDQASAYIADAGFQEAQVGDKHHDVLTVDPTNVPGQALLTIYSPLLVTPKNKPYAKRTHLLRHSLDGGKTWIVDEPTSTSRALIGGLPALVEIEFQVAAKDSSGTSAWCTSVPITLLK